MNYSGGKKKEKAWEEFIMLWLGRGNVFKEQEQAGIRMRISTDASCKEYFVHLGNVFIQYV